MKFSDLLSLLTLSSIATAANRDKRGVQVIKVTQTVDNTVTNTHVVDAPTSTVINWSTSTITSTTTHYTSTFTSTIFGNIYTYLSVYSSVVPVVENGGNTETETQGAEDSGEVTETQKVNDLTAAPTAESETAISETTIIATNSPSSMTFLSPSTQSPAVPASTRDSEPSLTTGGLETASITAATTTTGNIEDSESYINDSQITSFPSIWDGYTLGDSSTNVVSGSMCIVDYDYYSQDYTETVTSTSTIYQTVTV